MGQYASTAYRWELLQVPFEQRPRVGFLAMGVEQNKKEKREGKEGGVSWLQWRFLRGFGRGTPPTKSLVGVILLNYFADLIVAYHE